MCCCQGRNNIDEAVEIQVGGMSIAIMHTEPVIHDGGENSSITSGLHIDFGVADEHSFFGLSAKFSKDRVYTEGIRLFRGKTVSAVDSAKIFGEAESFQ